ncbi:energy-coupling factor transporter transmembrane component T [Enterococcus sp. 5H]|uniref:energy-coupling factor transporter transmembrane component T n=1 Tax=Enterococcus sp. 5H TaxID=1229490 RepID=UPI00230269F1|nr:energy-coupling factor transporter transmembrane component T [Enterococcus sp. 5H]MDA9470086.1 putative cobalamin ECF transporter [Enterococcus sp. 5H]
MNPHFFKRSHPFVSCCYFLLLLLIIISTTNPVIITSCFLATLSLRLVQLVGAKKTPIVFPLLLVIVITITNPLFVHRGGTILFFLFNKPITLEAFIYGFFIGLMMATVIYSFQNFQKSVDSERLFYLFGSKLPKLTMILTLIFRFIPLFQQYFQELNQVQKSVQLAEKRTFRDKAAYGFDLFGHFFSWAIENSLDTADSMLARGYGVSKRTSRLFYQWNSSDSIYLFGIFSFSIIFIYYLVVGKFEFSYYPYLEAIEPFIQLQWVNYLLIVIFAFIPTINRLKEAIIWAILKSKI